MATKKRTKTDIKKLMAADLAEYKKNPKKYGPMERTYGRGGTKTKKK